MTTRDNAGPRQGAAYLRDWTKGSILGNLLSLAWPVMIGSSLNSLGPVIDMIWVGKLGAGAVAGVGVAGMLVQLLDALKMGLDMGTRAVIARLVGAGENEKATHAALQGYVVAIGFAAIVGTLGAVFSGLILRVMGLSPDVVAQGAPYLRIQFIGILTMGIVRQNEGTMVSSGDTVHPMLVSVGYRIFHIALCPFLVFGWWVFPRLGTTGAAVTSIISTSLGAIAGLWFLISGRTRLRLSFRDFRPDFRTIWTIVRIGIPSSVTGIQQNLGQVLMTGFVVPFGTVAVAAHTLTQQIDQFVNIGGAGLGQSAGILAGQNLGARRAGPGDARRLAGRSSLHWHHGRGLGLAVVLGRVGRERLFNRDPQLVAIGATFIRIQIVSYLCLGYANVLQQCLNGVGDTMTTMVVVLGSTFAVQVPLAWFLSQHTAVGVNGTRWAIAAGTAVTAVAYVTYFRLGAWKRKRI